jgi:hypothetical protein
MSENKIYTVKIEDATDPDCDLGDLCVKIPDELLKKLDWREGDEVKWEETEIWEEEGEQKGVTLVNRTKLFRDAEVALRQAISTDME